MSPVPHVPSNSVGISGPPVRRSSYHPEYHTVRSTGGFRGTRHRRSADELPAWARASPRSATTAERLLSVTSGRGAPAHFGHDNRTARKVRSSSSQVSVHDPVLPPLRTGSRCGTRRPLWPRRLAKCRDRLHVLAQVSSLANGSPVVQSDSNGRWSSAENSAGCGTVAVHGRRDVLPRGSRSADTAYPGCRPLLPSVCPISAVPVGCLGPYLNARWPAPNPRWNKIYGLPHLAGSRNSDVDRFRTCRRPRCAELR